MVNGILDKRFLAGKGIDKSLGSKEEGKNKEVWSKVMAKIHHINLFLSLNSIYIYIYIYTPL